MNIFLDFKISKEVFSFILFLNLELLCNIFFVSVPVPPYTHLIFIFFPMYCLLHFVNTITLRYESMHYVYKTNFCYIEDGCICLGILNKLVNV